jgi:hypothetical protein
MARQPAPRRDGETGEQGAHRCDDPPCGMHSALPLAVLEIVDLPLMPFRGSFGLKRPQVPPFPALTLQPELVWPEFPYHALVVNDNDV